MSRIAERFEKLRQRGRRALIPYITAGYPRPDMTVPLLHALAGAGGDILEIGVPFSDPMADGPVVQRSGDCAIRQGVGLADVLGMVRDFRATDRDTPIVLMGYANPIEAMGIEIFIATSRESGVDGAIVVDYPPEECEPFAALARANGIDPIFLLAPTSTPARVREVARAARGYLYYVSLKGITGAGNLDTADVAAHLPEIRAASALPIAVGFGIRDAASARRVGEIADAVVIGSRIIEEIETAGPDRAVAQVSAFLSPIRAALDSLPAKALA